MSTQKKKILVLAPILTLPADLEKFLLMLGFLESDYVLDVLDPLLTLSHLDNTHYYQDWQKTLSVNIHEYHACIGFSFGGVILQQCFSLFSDKNEMPIILFSTPSFADSLLNEKLTGVLRLAENKQLREANQLKINYVAYPNLTEEIRLSPLNKELGCARLVEGITRILTTDSREILEKSSVKYHHFIGENSYLVNQENVIAGKSGTVINVPHAGMRVLTDNPIYCCQRIKDILL